VNAALRTPPVHLWVYNHPLLGISDQITFFCMAMRQQGYAVSLGRRPRQDALNVVIENFSDATSATLIDFCRRTGKRVALIMTEHLDLLGGELLIHGEPLWTHNDYMHPATQIARIKNLMDCVPYFSAILVLGDLPQLNGAGRMFPGLTVRTLPFPEVPRRSLGGQTPQHDFVFSGGPTSFREQVLKSLAARHTLARAPQLLPRRRRDQLNASARIVLNIPQRPGWRWLSLMRIIAALLCGRATVAIATKDDSRISRCCLQLEADELEKRSPALLADWRGAYDDAWRGYEAMRGEFLASQGFPADLFAYWALLEQIHTERGGPPCLR